MKTVAIEVHTEYGVRSTWEVWEASDSDRGHSCGFHFGRVVSINLSTTTGRRDGIGLACLASPLALPGREARIRGSFGPRTSEKDLTAAVLSLPVAAWPSTRHDAYWYPYDWAAVHG